MMAYSIFRCGCLQHLVHPAAPPIPNGYLPLAALHVSTAR
jgi:hypothetical protein